MSNDAVQKKQCRTTWSRKQGQEAWSKNEVRKLGQETRSNNTVQKQRSKKQVKQTGLKNRVIQYGAPKQIQNARSKNEVKKHGQKMSKTNQVEKQGQQTRSHKQYGPTAKVKKQGHGQGRTIPAKKCKKKPGRKDKVKQRGQHTRSDNTVQRKRSNKHKAKQNKRRNLGHKIGSTSQGRIIQSRTKHIEQKSKVERGQKNKVEQDGPKHIFKTIVSKRCEN